MVREVQRLVVAPAVVVDQRAEQVDAQIARQRRPLRLLPLIRATTGSMTTSDNGFTTRYCQGTALGFMFRAKVRVGHTVKTGMTLRLECFGSWADLQGDRCAKRLGLRWNLGLTWNSFMEETATCAVRSSRLPALYPSTTPTCSAPATAKSANRTPCTMANAAASTVRLA